MLCPPTRSGSVTFCQTVARAAASPAGTPRRLRRVARRWSARERERAGVGAVEACEQAQQRALAAAGRPDQADEFAVVDRHVEMVERQHRLAGHRRIDFDDAVRLDQRAGAGDCAGRGYRLARSVVAVAVIEGSFLPEAALLSSFYCGFLARVRPRSRWFRSPAPRARSASPPRATGSSERARNSSIDIRITGAARLIAATG